MRDMNATASDQFCVITAVNDDQVLQDNLLASPLFANSKVEHVQLRDQPSASIAYNRGLDQTSAPICIFAHQDVYFPRPWLDQLCEQMAKLEEVDPDWAVLGLFGVTSFPHYIGCVWSSGLQRQLGRELEMPLRAASVDEMVIILRRSSGLRFDEQLPGFHFYGTDIVQSARLAGLDGYVIYAPAVHNSVPVQTLDGAFHAAYSFMRNKWRRQLPIHTTVTRITTFGFHQWRLRRRYRRKQKVAEAERMSMHKLNARSAPEIARDLGYE
ncbi:MAG: glycosyltransferase [Parasphingorhabdus sp.]|nr:glycosyltransferase [Parasphingorhabdus sp.]